MADGSGFIKSPASGDNLLVAQTRPFSNGRIAKAYPAGFTIMQMMEMSGIDMRLAYRIGRVYVADPLRPELGIAEIKNDYWHCARPNAGYRIFLSLEPGKKKKGGGKAIFGLVLSIAVLAAAAWAGPALVGALAPGLTGFGATLLGGVVTGVIGFAGKLLIGALIPAATAPKPGSIAGAGASQADSPTYSIGGSQNAVQKYSPVPWVVGDFRFTPPFAALPYTEILGADQYLRLLFCFGYGPLDISEIKIGDTAIEEYDDVEMELRQGFPDDAPITLYSNQVIETPGGLSIEIKNDGIRTPAVAATGTLTLSSNPNNTETVTVGQTYTFVSVLTSTANQVLIGANAAESAANLVAAITRSAGAGSVYGAPTPLNTVVTAEVVSTSNVKVTAKTAGTAGNSIATTETLSAGSWGGAMLSGGAADVLYNPMDEDENWSTQTTGSNADEFSFDLTFPRGLVKYNSSGGKEEQTARFDIRYRLSGSSNDWTYKSVASHNELTVSGNPSNGQTVTIGGKAYTFQTTLTNVDGNVQIGVDAATSLGNLAAAVMLASGSGTKYAAATTRHADVDATAAPTVLTITARHRGNRTGPDGDGIACSETLSAGSWANTATVGGVDAEKITAKESAVRFGDRVVTGSPARYDVQFRRITLNSTDTAVQDQAVWTALRTIRYAAPVRMPGGVGVALLALRIRATDQLNGIIQNLSARCRSMAPVYADGEWGEPEITRNPAWLYAQAHRGGHLDEPIPDEKIDLDAIVAWAPDCDALADDGEPRFTCDGVIDYAATLDDVARAISATGRATPGQVDGKISIVRDVPQTVPVQHFTPRNSWGFKASKEFPDLPHAIRMRFKNEALDWEDDEITIYADGYDALTATIFEAETAGLETRANQIYRGVRYGMAQLKLRPEKYSLNADAESIICRRGDMVKVLHDVPRWGSGWARVKSVTMDGSDCTGVTLDMGVSMSAGADYVIRFRRADAERLDGGSQVLPVVTEPGIQTEIEFQDPVTGDDVPDKGDLVMFGPVDQEARDLIVLSIRRGEDFSAEIALADLSPAVHIADQGTIPPFDPGITSPLPIEFRRPEVPSILDIRSDETVLSLNTDGSYLAAIQLTIGAIATDQAPTAAVQVQYRPTGGTGRWSMTPAVEIAVGVVTILNVDIGAEYDLRVRAISRAGVVSAWSSPATHTVIGDTSLPPAPENPRVTGAEFRWDYPSPPRDFNGGGFRVLYNVGSSPNRTTATQLIGGLITTTTADISALTNGVYTVMVEAVDRSGNESAEAPFVVVDRGAPDVLNALVTEDFAGDGFVNGTITDGTVESGPELVADVENTAAWPSMLSAPAWSSSLGDPAWGVFAKQMMFEFTVDVATGDIGSSLKVIVTVEDAAWTLEYSTDAGGTWLTWPGQVVTDAVQYDFRLITAPGGEPGRVTELMSILDVPDAEEFLTNVVISIGGTRLPITAGRFRSIDHVAPTVLFESGEVAVGFRFDDFDPDDGPLCFALDGTASPTAGHGNFRVHGAQQVG